MRLEFVADFTLAYTRLDELDFEAGGQLYGEMVGAMDGPELRGELRMTNLGVHRTDDEYAPALKGTLTTPLARRLFVTMDGLSLRARGTSAPDRIGLVAVTFRTADRELEKWNRVFGVAECRGGIAPGAVGLVGKIYACVPEV